MVSDLFILYYLDYKLKRILQEYCLKIERYFNVSILKSVSEDKKTGDKENTFGAKINHFKKVCDDEDKLKIIKHYNTSIGSNFNSNNFLEFLESSRKIRNCVVHTYPLQSYKYSTNIKHGKKHGDPEQKEQYFYKDLNNMQKGVTKKNSQKLKEKISKHFGRYKFSTLDNYKRVLKSYFNVEDLNDLKFSDKKHNRVKHKTFMNFVSMARKKNEKNY
jgi:hypothetical protein